MPATDLQGHEGVGGQLPDANPRAEECGAFLEVNSVGFVSNIPVTLGPPGCSRRTFSSMKNLKIRSVI